MTRQSQSHGPVEVVHKRLAADQKNVLHTLLHAPHHINVAMKKKMHTLTECEVPSAPGLAGPHQTKVTRET